LKIEQHMVGLVLVAAATGSQAITVLSEGFDNVSDLPAAGWAQVNDSSAPVGTSWFQGNSGIFAASSGASNSTSLPTSSAPAVLPAPSATG